MHIEHQEFLTEYYNKHKPLTPQTALSTVVLNISEVCTRKCSCCPRGNGYVTPANKPTFMSFDIINKLCDDITDKFDGRFSISGLGEPTLHPQLSDIIKLLRKRCPLSTIFIITNGDKLTLDTVNMTELDAVVISVYSEEDMSVFYNKFGNIPKVRFTQQYTQNFIEHRMSNRAGNCRPLTEEEKKKTSRYICGMSFMSITIDTDGQVLPCSSDWKRETNYGNIMTDNIYNINTNRLKEVKVNQLIGKKYLTPLCSKCSGGGQYGKIISGKKLFVDWWKEYYGI